MPPGWSGCWLRWCLRCAAAGDCGNGWAACARAWGFSAEVAAVPFEVVPLQGVRVSGPSAEWLMRVLAAPAPDPGFNFGLLPGVFIGSFVGGWSGGDLKL